MSFWRRLLHRQRRLPRFARYAGVSVLATGLAQAGLFLAYGVMGWPIAPAVMFSLAVSVVPAYGLSRRYVWPDTANPRAGWGEATGFFVVAVIGSVTTLVLVWAAVRIAGTMTFDHVTLAFVANGASIAATGAVWIARYLVLNKLLFATRGLDTAVPAVTTRVGVRAYD
jgi:putative flippase GtrA